MAFAILGLVNNFVYVIFLLAAQDLIKNQAGVNEGMILLADILPSLVIKFTVPHVMHRLPYASRVLMFVSLSFASLLIVALVENIFVRLVGIVVASVSSGLGEITFLALTASEH